MPREISVLVFPLARAVPQLQIVTNDLEGFRRLVSGHLQALRLGGRVSLYCNEDADRLGLAPNRIVPGLNLIRGQFFLAAGFGGESVSLTEEEAIEWTRTGLRWAVAGLDFAETEIRDGGRFGA